MRRKIRNALLIPLTAGLLWCAPAADAKKVEKIPGLGVLSGKVLKCKKNKKICQLLVKRGNTVAEYSLTGNGNGIYKLHFFDVEMVIFGKMAAYYKLDVQGIDSKGVTFKIRKRIMPENFSGKFRVNYDGGRSDKNHAAARIVKVERTKKPGVAKITWRSWASSNEGVYVCKGKEVEKRILSGGFSFSFKNPDCRFHPLP
jgi:hypothetical protein